jgi:hypothetical protein
VTWALIAEAMAVCIYECHGSVSTSTIGDRGPDELTLNRHT